MGIADAAAKNYMDQNDVFADVFNFFLYNGRQVISPNSLTDANVEELAVLYLGDQRPESEQRYRDVFKNVVIKKNEQASYVLLGIENQTDVNYAMPVRNGIYDFLQYGKQVRNTAALHRKETGARKADSAEFLSGFHKEDKLKPVITLVMYYKSTKWDGPRSLKEMLDDCDPKMLPFIQDYKLNLIEPNALSKEDLEKFSTDLREVISFIKASGNKEEMQYLLNMDPVYKNMRTSAVCVLNACTDVKIKVDKDKETFDMCQAIYEMQQEAVEKAVREVRKEAEKTRKEAVEEARKEARKNTEDAVFSNLLHTAKSLMANMHWSADEALTAMGVSDSDYRLLLPLLQKYSF